MKRGKEQWNIIVSTRPQLRLAVNRSTSLDSSRLPLQIGLKCVPSLSPEENLFFLPCLRSGNQILVAVAKYSTVIQIQKCLIYLQGANRRNWEFPYQQFSGCPQRFRTECLIISSDEVGWRNLSVQFSFIFLSIFSPIWQSCLSDRFLNTLHQFYF